MLQNQFCAMLIPNINTWHRWKNIRRKKRFLILMDKHKRIVQDGICIYAKIERVHPYQSYTDVFLLQTQLCINLPGDITLHTTTRCITRHQYLKLEGKTIRMKLLPGDLSQAVLLE